MGAFALASFDRACQHGARGMKTILDIFRTQSIHTPDKTLYTLVDADGHDRAQLTYGQLARAADGIAATLLHQHGLRQGDRVLLVYPQSLDFIAALVGCMTAGIIPVPVYPPNPLNPGRTVTLFAQLAAQCDAKAVLTNGEYNRMRQFGSVKNFFVRSEANWPNLSWIRTDKINADKVAANHKDISFPQCSMDDIAFLQFTSGSTSNPKGVMVTYANLDHQLRCNARELDFHPEARIVMWVPQYHDFGLISGILNALYGNGQVYMLSPIDFIKRPAVWFEVASRVRATHIAAPNFAYELAVRKTTAEQRAEWDLRTLEIVMSAAEPIQPQTVARFLDAFAAAGLRQEAFCPAYGLAEHTVGVSVRGRAALKVNRSELAAGRVRPLPGHVGTDTTELIGCGRPSAGVHVRIVEPETCMPCAPGEIGEIWIDSPSKAAGYFRLAVCRSERGMGSPGR